MPRANRALKKSTRPADNYGVNRRWSPQSVLRAPHGLLARVRWGLMLFAQANLAVLALGIAFDAHPRVDGWPRIVGLAGVLGLMALFVRQDQRGRANFTMVVTDAIALLAIIQSLHTVTQVLSALFVSLNLRAAYASGRTVGALIGSYICAYLIGAQVLAPIPVSDSPSQLFQTSIGMVLAGGMVFALANLLGRHERSTSRERKLRECVSALVAAANADAVYVAALEAVAQLLSTERVEVEHIWLAEKNGTRFRVAAERGPFAPTGLGRSIGSTEEFLPAACTVAEVIDAARTRALHRHLGFTDEPGFGCIVPCIGTQGTTHLIVASGPQYLRRLSDCRDALTTLGAQVALALDALGLRDQLLHQATHDALTDLANRRLFLDAIEGALASPRTAHGAAAVLFVDLDEFKKINDELGHQAGDDVLVAVARRLEHALARASQELQPVRYRIARLGGDEFGILVENCPRRQTAIELATRVLSELCAPLRVAGQDLHPRGSVGVVLASGGESATELLNRADAGMYDAKRSGGGKVVAYAAAPDDTGTDHCYLNAA